MYLIACPKLELEFDAKKEEQRRKENKRAQLKALEESEKQLVEEMKMKENKSPTAKFLAKILDNFQLQINRIHLRLEDHSSCKSCSFAAGIILEKLYVNSDNVLGEKRSSLQGVIDKKLELKKLGVYWDTTNPVDINTDTIDSLKSGMKVPFLTQVPMKLQDLSPREFILHPISLKLRIIVDMRKVEDRRPSIDNAISATFQEFHFSKDIKNALSDSYRHAQKKETMLENCRKHFDSHLSKKYSQLLSSMDSKSSSEFFDRCWEKQHTASAIVRIDGDLDSFAFTLRHQQFATLTEFISGLSIQSVRASYRQFRPSHEDVESFPREWWRFAIQCVMQNNRKNRQHRSWREFQSYKARREEYILLYKRKQGMKPSLKKDPKGLVRLQKLEDSFSVQEIQIFRQLALSQLTEETEGKKKSLYSLRKSPSPQPDDERRREIWSRFDIDPDESPWEGENAKDVQIRLDFRIHKIGLDLVREKKQLISVVFENVGMCVVKRREFLQFWCSLQDLSLKYLHDIDKPWNNIIYPEKEAMMDKQKSVLFLPKEVILTPDEIPFFQLSIESPLQKEGAFRLRCITLPLSLVGDVECVLDVVTFFSEPLSAMNLDGFSARESNLSASQRRRVRIAREMSSHRQFDVDVYVGPIHLLLPEDSHSVNSSSQTLALRLGNLSFCSKSDHDAERSLLSDVEAISNVKEDRFDRYELHVRGISLLLTDGHVDWMKPSVQKSARLSLLDDFELHALIGRCITPSEVSLPNLEVICSLSLLHLCLQRSQYMTMLQWAEGFETQLERLVERFANQMMQLSKVTKRLVEWIWADLGDVRGDNEKNSKKRTQLQVQEKVRDYRGYDEDELSFLFSKPTLSMRLLFPGVSLTIENDDETLAEFQLRHFCVSVVEQAFSLHVDITLSELVGKDTTRSVSQKKESYLVISKGMDTLEQVDDTSQNQLIHVEVDVVKRSSPRFQSAPSHITVGIELGPLSGRIGFSMSYSGHFPSIDFPDFQFLFAYFESAPKLPCERYSPLQRRSSTVSSPSDLPTASSLLIPTKLEAEQRKSFGVATVGRSDIDIGTPIFLF